MPTFDINRAEMVREQACAFADEREQQAIFEALDFQKYFDEKMAEERDH